MSLPVLQISPSAGQVGASKAPQACETCRKQKRRCDKALPSCNLCVRMRRPCDYTETNPQPSSEDFAAMQIRLIELESRLNTHSPALSAASIGGGTTPPQLSSTPSLFPPDPIWKPQASLQFPVEIFLDYAYWQRLGQVVPQPLVEIPGEVLALLGDGDTIQQAIMDYFETVHSWLPIISKSRINSSTSLYGGGPDLAMLFLAMKLAATAPIEGVAAAYHYVYTTTKRFLYMLEHSGLTSVMVLQSMVLVAIYEFGHGIYPTAWVTVGACARMVDFLGLPDVKESSYILNPAQTMVELEERRRTWWAVIVLDRVICLGNQRRSILPEPHKQEILPIEDDMWDDGSLSFATHRSYEDPFTGSSSPFARLCEASFLVSRALDHVRAHPLDRKTANESFPIEDYTNILNDTNHALSVLDAEAAAAMDSCSFANPSFHTACSSSSSTTCLNPFLAAQSLLLSATMMVQDTYCGPATCVPQTREEAAHQRRAIVGINQSTARFLDLLYRSLPNWSSSASPSPSAMSQTYLGPYQHHDYLSGGGGSRASGRNSPIMVVDGLLRAVSPLILDALYFTSSTFARAVKEGGFPDQADEAKNKLEASRRLLARLNSRWRVAGEYTRILEAQDREMSINMAATGP